MAETEIKYDHRKALSFFAGMKKRAKSVADADENFAREISVIVFKNIMDHFDKETGPTGKWQAWSDMYRERMIKAGKGGNKILQDTGRLRGNFKPESYRRRTGEIEWYNNAMSDDGKPYAYYHNEGIAPYPERRFMWLSKDVERRIAALSLAYITGSTRGGGE